MGNDILGYLTALGLGAIIVEIIRSFIQRRKMGADTAEVISRSALALLQPLEKRVHELESELAKANQELMAVRAEWRMTKGELSSAREEVRMLRAEAANGREEIRRGPHYYKEGDEP